MTAELDPAIGVSAPCDIAAPFPCAGFRKARVAAEHADQPPDRRWKTAQPLVVAGLARQLGEQMRQMVPANRSQRVSPHTNRHAAIPGPRILMPRARSDNLLIGWRSPDAQECQLIRYSTLVCGQSRHQRDGPLALCDLFSDIGQAPAS